jgi:ABC-2 type transport system ATP-binding protein
VRGDKAKALEALAGLGPVTVAQEDGAVLSLRLEVSPDLRPKVAQALVGAGLELLRLDRGTQRLESIFLSLTRNGGASSQEVSS